MKYLELIEKNRELGTLLQNEKFEIHILSNIIVNELKNVLEYNLRINNLNADCFITDYDSEEIQKKIKIIFNSNKRSNGRKRMKAFSLDKIAEKVFEVYNTFYQKN